MKTKFILRFLVALSVSASVMVAPVLAADKALQVTAYYFPNAQQCTAMIDYQASKETVSGVSGDSRALLLAKDMLAEYASHASDQCKSAPKVRLLAVFITGLDNYGRPDFGNRTNLLRLEGDSDKVGLLVRDISNLSVEKIRSAITLDAADK